MFDPHIYTCQTVISGSTSNPTIQSMSMMGNNSNNNMNNMNDGQLRNHNTPTSTSSPQKSKHLNSNTVIPIQSGNATPQRKQSKQEEEEHFVANAQNENGTQQGNQLIAAAATIVASGSNSGENSRKTSTISDYTSSECTPENTVSALTPKQDHGEIQIQSLTPNIPIDQIQSKQSPARKLSRFLVSPTVIETANKELIVQEDVTQQMINNNNATSFLQQQFQLSEVEMNINEESYQRTEQTQITESELIPQQSIGFRMPETLEQLKIELENITHAHVSTKPKEIVLQQQMNLQPAEIQDDNNNTDTVSEAHVENSVEYNTTATNNTDPVGTGENTSVYNSRRTSADMNTNQTDLTSTASGVMDYDENLASEAVDDANINQNRRPIIQNQVPQQQQQQPIPTERYLMLYLYLSHSLINFCLKFWTEFNC